MSEQKTINEEETENKNKPLYKIKFGGITGTAWEHEKFKSFTLNKVYKDKSGEFKYTNSFNLNDLPKAILCLKELYKKETEKTEA